MTIAETGHVIIGSQTPNNIFQVDDGSKLRVSYASGFNNYSIIGTKDTDENTTNTKIFMNGNPCTFAGAAGSFQYFTVMESGTGCHTSSWSAGTC